jgi:hypothetical protein
MATWFTAGADSYNIDMIIRIHDPGNADLSGVTVTIVGMPAPIAVPPALVQNLRNRIGYNEALTARPPSMPTPALPPVVFQT